MAGIFLLLNPPAFAVPTQFGDTGLISQPSAETLDAGNICFGVWYNQSEGEKGSASTVPVSLTMGLGSFLEAYGSYPNILFNDDDIKSGRGNISLGFKARVYGKRSDIVKIAIDLQGRRSVSDEPELDGINSYQGRVVASLKKDRFGAHLNMGYRMNDDPEAIEYDDQIVAGAGVEFFPETRLRLMAEVEFATEKIKGSGEEGEASLGLQYFVSPHLTLSTGLALGLLDASPDWRALLGFSTCQGVGTYLKPVPRIIQPSEEIEPSPEVEDEKPVKIRPLSPLLAGKVKPRRKGPVEKLEVPLASSVQEVVLTPDEKLFKAAASSSIKTYPFSPVSPMSSAVQSPLERTATAQISGDEGKSGDTESPIAANVYRKFRLPEFSFDFNQWSLSEEGKKALSKIIAYLREEGRWYFLRIDGHTDNVGSEKYNKKLSLQRAIAMGAYLASNEGLDPERIFVRGFGESQPIASNETPEGRSENRRAEILVLVSRDQKN